MNRTKATTTNLGLLNTKYLLLTGGTLTGDLTLTPAANSTTTFQVNQAAGANVLTVDTTNKRVGIGTASPVMIQHIFGGSDYGSRTMFEPQSSFANIFSVGGNWNAAAGQSFSIDEHYYSGARTGLGVINSRLLISQSGLVGINTTSPGAQLDVVSSAAATKGLIVKGAASQSVNLQEWQNSAGTILSYIDASGFLNILQPTATGGLVKVGYNTSVYATMGLGSAGPFVVDIYGGGGGAGMVLWKNAGSTVLALSNTGQFSFTTTQMIKNQTGNWRAADVNGTSYSDYGVNANVGYGSLNLVGAGIYGWVFEDNGTDRIFINKADGRTFINGAFTYSPESIQLKVTAGNAAWTVLTVKGAASQSANLFEAQNSAGAVLASFDLAGVLTTAGYKSSDGSAGVTSTVTFYASATSGGTVTVLNTVTIKNGIITGWTQA